MEKLFNKNSEDIKRSLLNAVEKDDVTGLKEILKLSVDANAANFQGRTPLFYANSPEVAGLLIAAGADANAKDKFNRSPLHLIQDIKTAKLIIESGADVNAVDGNNATPLHYAACKGDIAMAQLLIGKGADLYIKDNKGQTALEDALNYENWDIAKAINARKLNAAGQKASKQNISLRKF